MNNASRRLWFPWAVLLCSLTLSLFLVSRGRLNPDVMALLPKDGESHALSEYLRVFGGGGVSVVLIEGGDLAERRAVAADLADRLRARPGVTFAAARVDLEAPEERPSPWLAWRRADERGRARLAELFTPEGLRERLAESRALLLAPGSGAASLEVQRDPLRLDELALRERAIGSGIASTGDGYFGSAEASLVVVKTAGQALRGSDARAFVDAVDSAIVASTEAHPAVTARLTGPHAVAAQMESMLRRDLTVSSIASTVLASLVFIVIFRRVRALIAIVPPLLLGTLWTGALATLWPGGVSAIAVAFTSIVVGVGFDTGVHVYSAILKGRRLGIAPDQIASYARRETARPVLIAAAIAGVAFGSLALSSVSALAQLGILCGVGEVLTAVAIVAVTPAVGALLERGTPPATSTGRLARFLTALTRTRARALIVLSVALVLGIGSLARGVTLSKSIVAVRPKNLPALDVEARIFELFGGKSEPFIVMTRGDSLEQALSSADRIAEALALDPNIEAVDALTALAPSAETQRARLKERDALPISRAALEKALSEQGFRPERFATFLDGWDARPTEAETPTLTGGLSVVASRYVAEEGGRWFATLHVHPKHFDALRDHVRAIDPTAEVTGYARLELDLGRALRQDLPKVGWVAGALVLVLLAVSLRNLKDIILAAGVLLIGLGALFGTISMLGLSLHLYSALVIPVLLGISVDEAMFLLHHARGAEADPVETALGEEAIPVLTTAFTTSAGLVALAFSEYAALSDLGLLGATGNLMNLVVALLLVPAGLRLLHRGKTRNGTTEPSR